MAAMVETILPQRSRQWHAIIAASVGNALEWFDFVVYGFFAITIAKLFFPAADESISLLVELRAKEIGVSLDDFGTGFASLGYLNDFPFSKIKIDRKFTANIDQSARTSANIGGIARITRDLKIELVAEGIETENQLERMRSFGISAVQGFLFSRPVPAPELRRLISKPITPGLPPPVRMRGPIYSGVERKAAS
jgi:predicted signal transduction protein with EAL and GGDEF domain